jgi:hypothetical protein
MNDNKTKNLISKLEWYKKFFKEQSMASSLTEQERLERVIKSETYSEIIEIIKHDLGIKAGKRSA